MRISKAAVQYCSGTALLVFSEIAQLLIGHGDVVFV